MLKLLKAGLRLERGENHTYRADDKGRHRTHRVRGSTRGEDPILIVPFEDIHGDQSEQDETRSLQGTL